MFAYLEILRINVCILAVLGLLVGSIISGALYFPTLVLYAVIATFFICGSGDVINDYFDYKIDKINKPYRPLPSGRISRKNALIYFILLVLVGLTFALMVSIPFLIIATFNLLVVVAYPWRLKKIPLVGNMAVSYLAISTYLAAGLIVGSFSSLFASPLLILVLICFFGVLSREIFKSIEDTEGDKKLKLKTLPIVIGKGKSTLLARIFLFIGIVLLILPYYYKIFSDWYLIAVLPSIFICIYVLLRSEARKAQKTLKVVMYLVILAFLVGVLTK
ncbi:MAG: UbiA family prenyltransferase [Candidatus Aenigmarchaeota archaeon]|nr:UbiA family prenyltransferase [Candidatus Aenigmarchaeota archaeon]